MGELMAGRPRCVLERFRLFRPVWASRWPWPAVVWLWPRPLPPALRAERLLRLLRLLPWELWDASLRAADFLLVGIV